MWYKADILPVNALCLLSVLRAYAKKKK